MKSTAKIRIIPISEQPIVSIIKRWIKEGLCVIHDTSPESMTSLFYHESDMPDSSKIDPGRSNDNHQKTGREAAKSVNKVKESLRQEERQQMIAEAAWYLAEKRDFMSGDALQDWLLAENEINILLDEQR